MVVVCKKKKKKPLPAWVFLKKKMPEKQLILFAWPKVINFISLESSCFNLGSTTFNGFLFSILLSEFFFIFVKKK